MTKILAGIIAAAAIAIGGLVYWLSNVIESRAVLRQANDANLAAIARLESDIVINEAKAIADALERRALEADTRELEKVISDAAKNDCRNPGLDDLIERRRVQRARDGDKDR